MPHMSIEEMLDYLAPYLTERCLERLKERLAAEKKAAVGETAALIKRLINNLKTLPGLNGTDGQGDKAQARLHYSGPELDVYVTELERETREGYGLMVRSGEGEVGYLSLDEILNELKLELDLSFTSPATIASLLQYHSTRPSEAPESIEKASESSPLPPSDSFDQILAQNREVLKRWAFKILNKQRDIQGQDHQLRYDASRRKCVIDLVFTYEEEVETDGLYLLDTLSRAPVRKHPGNEKETMACIADLEARLTLLLHKIDPS